MRILLPDMHSTIPQSFANAFASFDATLLLLGKSFIDLVKYGRKWTQDEVDNELGLDNVFVVEYEDVVNSPPDVVMITCYEVQNDVLTYIWPRMNPEKTKLVHYSGNDNTGRYYDQSYLKNIICADVNSYVHTRMNDIHNVYYFPWIDYETFSFAGHGDGNVIRSYINEYQTLFSGGYKVAESAMETMSDLLWTPISGVPKKDTPQLMEQSIATLHCKELEGYGYAIIESIARGRPVFIYRPFSRERSYTQWVVEGETGFYFDTNEEFAEKMGRFYRDDEYRHNVQENAARQIREVINNEEQNEKLKIFFENLR